MVLMAKKTLIIIGAGFFAGSALQSLSRKGCNEEYNKKTVSYTKSPLEEKFDNERADWRGRRVRLGLELIQPYVSENCERVPTYSVGNPDVVNFVTIAELIGDDENASCPPIGWIYEQMSDAERKELKDISWGSGVYSLGNYSQ